MTRPQSLANFVSTSEVKIVDVEYSYKRRIEGSVALQSGVKMATAGLNRNSSQQT